MLLVVVLCLGGRHAVVAVDFDYPVVFNFSDSNSDTGGRIAVGFKSIAPPYGSTFFGSPSICFYDGRLIIDFLSKHISLSLILRH